ncbi:MAG: IS66 family transposase [Rubrivivax sp.]|nr:IS66 family transposase [Pyrinomonadaceae bacterium]
MAFAGRLRPRLPEKQEGIGILLPPAAATFTAEGSTGRQELRSAMIAMREVRAIYHQGVYAVAATFRQLYEMIEVEDERVHRLVAAATAAHLHKIERLTGRIARLEEELAVKARQVHRLELTAKELKKELKEARAQTRQARERHLAHLMKDSQNSSMPPSQDRHKPRRSLRERSGRKPGGQVGHPGTTLGFVEKPDRLVTHTPADCYLCGSTLGGSEVARTERRQVHDLPPPKIVVTEHQAQTKVCRRCGAKNKAEFPAGVKAPVQYGEGVRSVAAYLLGYQLLPYDRCAEAMADLIGCSISPGTLAALLKGCAGELTGPELVIKEGLRQAKVIGVDETGLRVAKRQDWVHVSATGKLTLLVHDRRRGQPAISGIDILPRYEGVCVHDGFSSYDQYERCRHAQCNAHLLRELNYVIETSKPRWAAGMKELLLEIKAAVEDARQGGREKLPPRLKGAFLRRYDAEIEEAKRLYGALRKKGRAKKPRAAESPIRAAGRKLACRLEAKREEILLFMHDLTVPFDNNQSERDLRMLKVKQKVSGCFRTEEGAAEFCRMRSYISTMKKQGHSVMETIRSVFAGKVLVPTLRC